MSNGVIRVGISGWTFAPWRGTFYPKGLLRQQELGFAAAHFRMLEATGSFYGLQRPETFRNWAEQVPAAFAFSVKAPRQITHVQRLQDIDAPLSAFCASGILHLGLHLGPVVWQLPANLGFDPKRIETFLGRLPRTVGEAARLAHQHEQQALPTCWPSGQDVRPLRHAIDVRHNSFACQSFVDLLRAHEVALVCDDTPGRAARMDLTSDFVYCRLRGSTAGDYDANALEAWIARSRTWAAGGEPVDAQRIAGKGKPRKRDVFLVLDTLNKLRAPVNALELSRRLRM